MGQIGPQPVFVMAHELRMVFLIFWLHCMACRISVPWPGIESGPQQWKPRILTTRQPGNFLLFNIFGWLKKIKRRTILLTHENNMKLKFQCPQMKSYWNAASLGSFTSCLWLLSSSSGRVEWSWQRVYSSQNQKYLLSGSLQKKEIVDPWNTLNVSCH